MSGTHKFTQSIIDNHIILEHKLYILLSFLRFPIPPMKYKLLRNIKNKIVICLTLFLKGLIKTLKFL
jgi:hypothetical protein